MQQVNLESVESVLKNICQRSRDVAKIGFKLTKVNFEVEVDGSSYITLSCDIKPNYCGIREALIDTLCSEVKQKFGIKVGVIFYHFN